MKEPVNIHMMKIKLVFSNNRKKGNVFKQCKIKLVFPNNKKRQCSKTMGEKTHVSKQ